MSYTKKTWQTGDTITSAALNNMENGIKAHDDAIAEISPVFSVENNVVTITFTPTAAQVLSFPAAN